MDSKTERLVAAQQKAEGIKQIDGHWWRTVTRNRLQQIGKDTNRKNRRAIEAVLREYSGQQNFHICLAHKTGFRHMAETEWSKHKYFADR